MINVVHDVFARYFKDDALAPYLYALSKRMEDGHVCLDLKQIPKEYEFWDAFKGEQPQHNSFPVNSTLIGSGSEEKKPFVLAHDKLYINRNYFYETQIIEKLKLLVDAGNAQLEVRKKALEQQMNFIKNLRSNDDNLAAFSPEEKPDWQLVAAIQGVLNNVTLVTGGPGTGKTTTVAKILALLNKMEPNVNVALTAPTGKAAVRMKESLQNTVKDSRNKALALEQMVGALDPKTIHRLLGAIHQSPFFKHNADNPLDYDVVIVDEASMIGVGLFAKLLSALKPMSRLIILGDSEQLASVDSGSLFGDLCSGLKLNENQFEAHHLDFINAFLREDRKLGGDYVLKESTTVLDQHLVRLKKTYRYDQNSKMGQFTKAVIHGQEDKLDDILQISEDSLVLDEFYEEAVFNNFIKGYYKFIEEPDINKALEKLNHCRVLCAVRQGDQGIYKINARIESQLKAHYKNQKTHSFHPTDGFYHNQPIMVTQNTPEINLFNGDVGIVRKDENGRLKAYFVNPKKETDGKDLMLINPASIPAWETVFAMTIHKSQGSEFNKVLVLLPKQQENRILTRELLYTGVTRAKEKAIIQSSLDLIKSTTQKAVNRVSGVQDRIQCSSTKK